MDLKRTALKTRVAQVKIGLSAHAYNAPIGAVEIPNKLFDELADVIEELELIAFEEPAPARRPTVRISKSDKPRKKPAKKAASTKAKTKTVRK